MTIGERVNLLRGKKTLAEFGESVGVSGSQISAIENAKSNMSFDLAARICDMYGCTGYFADAEPEENDELVFKVFGE